MANRSVVTGFFLVEFSSTRELQIIQGLLFLLIYLVTLTVNLLIIVLVTLDQALHTPMYFFLKNLSLLDSCLISVTVPKSIFNSFSGTCAISLPECLLQVLLVIHFAGAEVLLLTTMSYDRYVAISRPLHYEVIMSRELCVRMAVASWGLGGVFGGLYSGGTFSLSFCGPRKLPQFFCDVPSLLKISCSEAHIAIDISVAIGVFYGAVCLLAIVCSYVYIFRAVLSIPSGRSRPKAFSTCLPHLLVVTTFLLTGGTAYLKPVPESPSARDLLLSVLYSILPPTLNPVIYSLRKKDVTAALRRLIHRPGRSGP